MRDNVADIRVFGVGGGGCNALNKMICSNIQGATFYAVNTDAQALNASKAEFKMPIGTLGAGANPEVGKKGAIDHVEDLRNMLKGADMIYITAGMGGGTGTGAAPVIAELAKQMGILTIAIVTIPFKFEGPKRNEQARKGIKELEKHVDSLIVVSNDKLLETSGKLSLKDSFAVADDVLRKGVQSVVDIIQSSALINLDFADVKSIMTNAGNAMIGIGEGKGENRAIEAAKNALNSPLLEVSPDGATKAIINVAGGKDISIQDAYEAVEYVRNQTNSNLDTIFGVSLNEEAKDDSMIITVILTGLKESKVSNKFIEKTKPKEVTIPKEITVSKEEDVEVRSEEIINFNKPLIVNETKKNEERPTRLRRSNLIDDREMDTFLKRLS